MLTETRKRIMTNPVFKVVRWTVPWAALIVVVVLTYGYWNEFQHTKPPVEVTASDQTSTPTSSTANATSTVPAGTSAVALMDGIRIRVTPSATGQIVASIGKGATMAILAQRKDWFMVRDSLGRQGWITSSPAFVQVTIAR